VKTSSSHDAGNGALLKPRGTGPTEIDTILVSTAAGGIATRNRSRGIVRMKGRTRCGVTLSDVGIESLLPVRD